MIMMNGEPVIFYSGLQRGVALITAEVDMLRYLFVYTNSYGSRVLWKNWEFRKGPQFLYMMTIRVQLLLQRMMGIQFEQSTSTFVIFPSHLFS
ncbi:unnamed protein product [Albugo candida]|uniref:Uncharacterized protein n=1 Tax=Albugo candida TaxID=65357 RepID=A0A024GB57_9STRA|nr:unnamed protein product [Albugo candida]|eukprot:CCI44101.1 unnamed protein product [Albugo candida]